MINLLVTIVVLCGSYYTRTVLFSVSRKTVARKFSTGGLCSSAGGALHLCGGA